MKRWLGRAMLLLTGVLLGALLGELTLRVIGYEGAHGRQGTVLGSRYGRVPPDKWIFRLEIDPASQSHVVIREQSIPLEKPPGETRMLFIGDSGTAGLYLDFEHSFPVQFQGLLDEEQPGNDVRVINAGAVGMTTVGEYYLLRDKLLHLKPDVVVLGLFLANDINFNLGHQEREDARGSNWLARLSQRSVLAHYLHLRTLAHRERDGLWGDTPPVALTLVDRDGLHMLSDPAGEIATYQKQPSEMTGRAFEVLRGVLQDILDLGAERDFTFAVLLIPTRSTVTGRLDLPHHPRMLQDLAEHGVHIRQADLDFNQPTRRVQAICEDLGIPCIDPTVPMQAIGLEAFLPEDEHTSIEGHRALARELLAHLEVLLPRD